MKIEVRDNTLFVSDIAELNAINASAFRDEIRAALQPTTTGIEINFSQTRFLDSSGLGALFAVYKLVSRQNDQTTMRIINPRPPIRQLMELTQLHQLFEIVRR